MTAQTDNAMMMPWLVYQKLDRVRLRTSQVRQA